MTLAALYADMYIVATDPPRDYSLLFNDRNTSLKYIRNLTILVQHGEERERLLADLLTQVLRYVPPDTLRKIIYDPRLYIPGHLFVRMLFHQRYLTFLIPQARDSSLLVEYLEAALTDYGDAFFSSIQSLALDENRDSWELHRYLISKCTNLRGFHRYAAAAVTQLHLRDHYHDLVRLSESSHLTLNGIDWSSSQSGSWAGLNFGNLVSLRLTAPASARYFLQTFRERSDFPLGLKYFEAVLICERGRSYSRNVAVRVLENFLHAFSGLIELSVSIYGESLPSVRSISNHAQTLLVLDLHAIDATSAGQYREVVYPAAHFRLLCENLSRLRQLSCGFPAMSKAVMKTRKYPGLMYSCALLKELTTLILSPWPSSGAEDMHSDQDLAFLNDQILKIIKFLKGSTHPWVPEHYGSGRLHKSFTGQPRDRLPCLSVLGIGGWISPSPSHTDHDWYCLFQLDTTWLMGGHAYVQVSQVANNTELHRVASQCDVLRSKWMCSRGASSAYGELAYGF
ncbi:hypothetical protein K461DRAFT_321672 [Myriangium duriaei CBS 260.36]|uniref:Uncharacterized protein n=1 Tax=Myriangium duriaei CBS 260.36 TaxID=1168546 RepID=A0A9P4J5E2_9PEZI|nr:hypothetical protein K461DRAFT_321672 [Myriangium duriaei CBS 260.36]